MLDRREARRCRDFAWLRIAVAGGTLSAVNCAMLAAGGVSLSLLAPIFMAAWLGWFILLTLCYCWTLRKSGVVVFPMPYWRRGTSRKGRGRSD